MNTLKKVALGLTIAGLANVAMAHEHGIMNLPTPHHDTTASAGNAQYAPVFDVLDAGNQK